MARILLVEDTPDLGLFEAKILETAGHQIIHCGGGSSPFGVCPMLKGESCGLADCANVIIFSCRVFTQLPMRAYRGLQLLRAYRAHPVYGRLPFLVVVLGDPGKLEGIGPIEVVQKFADPKDIIDAVQRLLVKTEHAPAEVILPDAPDATDAFPAIVDPVGAGFRVW